MKAQYTGRREAAVPTTLVIERDLREWLDQVTPGKRKGTFISLLLMAEKVRREERTRIAAEYQPECLAD